MRIFPLIFLIAMSGCKATLTPLEFARYCEDPKNGLVASQTKGDVQIELRYIPDQLMALHEFHGAIDKAAFDTILETYQGMRYFNLKFIPSDNKTDILLLNATTKDDYYQRVQYFSSMVNEDLKLIVGRDTVPCSIHHYERTYHLSPVVDLMIGFEETKSDINDNLIIMYQDKILGLETIKMQIESKKIAEIPALKL